MSGKKRKKKRKTSDPGEKLNPLISIEEHRGERLYAIVDFSLPGDSEVRRVISKKNGDDTITAVTYIGKVGADRTCCIKRCVMEMPNVPPEKFWYTINVLKALYEIRGAIAEIRNFEGKTIREAAGLMRMQGNAKVWTASEKPEHESLFDTSSPSDIIH